MKSLIIAIEINLFVTGVICISIIANSGTLTSISFEGVVQGIVIDTILLYPIVVVGRGIIHVISTVAWNMSH